MCRIPTDPYVIVIYIYIFVCVCLLYVALQACGDDGGEVRIKGECKRACVST